MITPPESRLLPCRRPQGGFTLLELIIAASLSIVVVLLAYAAIRTAGKAVSSMERASTQSAMLRTAFILVAEQTRRFPDITSPTALSDRPRLLPDNPPKTWPVATIIPQVPTPGAKSRLKLQLVNEINGTTTIIDLGMTGAR